MQGSVFRIRIQSETQNEPHPHVVVIDFSEDKDCLVVPAFSSGRPWIEKYLDALSKQGLERDQACVEIDNKKHCEFEPGFTPRPAVWLVERFRRISKSKLRRCVRLGKMKDSGMKLIVDGLLDLATACPERFSRVVVKRLKALKKKYGRL